MAAFDIFRVTLIIGLVVAVYFGYFDPNQKISETFRRATVVNSKCQTDGQIALTFDNGVKPDYTAALLTTLNTLGIKATFHIATNHLDQDIVQEVVKSIQKNGHTIGLGYAGVAPNTITTAQLRIEVSSQIKLIEDLIGVKVKYIRFPWQTTSASSDLFIQDEMKLVQTTYSVDITSYAQCTNAANMAAAMRNAADLKLAPYKSLNVKGSFIILSSDLCDVAKGVNDLVVAVKSNYGHSFVSLDQCLGIPPPPPPPPVTSTKIGTITETIGTSTVVRTTTYSSASQPTATKSATINSAHTTISGINIIAAVLSVILCVIMI